MKIAIDEDHFTELGLTYSRSGDVATFTVPEQPGTIQAVIEGDTLILFPDRSAGHRRLIAILK